MLWDHHPTFTPFGNIGHQQKAAIWLCCLPELAVTSFHVLQKALVSSTIVRLWDVSIKKPEQLAYKYGPNILNPTTDNNKLFLFSNMFSGSDFLPDFR